MKVLACGGAGYIGSQISLLLKEQGHQAASLAADGENYAH